MKNKVMYLFNRFFLFITVTIALSGQLYTPLYAAGRGEMIHRVYVTGLKFSINSRSGVFELSHGKEQHVRYGPVPMVGIELGKRFSIIKNLRLLVPTDLGFGYITEDPEVVGLENGAPAELEIRRNYLHFGLSPQFQYAIPVVEKKTLFYLSLGAGINYAIFNEEERVKGNSRIRIIDSYLEEGRTVAFSFDAGSGLDIILTKKQALSVVYGFKLWQPVNYTTSRDLFPYSAVRFKETFITHKIGIQFLISRR